MTPLRRGGRQPSYRLRLLPTICVLITVISLDRLSISQQSRATGGLRGANHFQKIWNSVRRRNHVANPQARTFEEERGVGSHPSRFNVLTIVPVAQMLAILIFMQYNAHRSRRRQSFDVSPEEKESTKRAVKWVTLPIYDKFLGLVLIAYVVECVLSIFCSCDSSAWQGWASSLAHIMRTVGTAGLRVFVCGFVSLYLVQWDMGWPAFWRSMTLSFLLALVVVLPRLLESVLPELFEWHSITKAVDALLTLVWITVGTWALCARRSVKGRFGAPFVLFVMYLIIQQLLYICARWAADVLYLFVFPVLLYVTLLGDSQFWRTIGERIKGLGRRKHSFLDMMPEVTREDISLALVAQVPTLDFTRLERQHSFTFASGSTSKITRTLYRGKQVALKHCTLNPYTIESVLDFSKEAFLYSQLDHPNIVKFLGVCISPPNFYIVCEYCSHKSLLHVLKSKAKIDWATRLKFALDAARGMMFAHEQNIMHRDLKTMNLLVHHTGKEYVVKVCDFGSSRLLLGNQRQHAFEAHQSMNLHADEDSMMTGVVGTIAYMAPELLRSLVARNSYNNTDVKRTQRKLSMYGFAVDVFSFGYVMWEIMTRKLPYSGMKVAEIRAAVLENRLPGLPAHKDPQVRRYMKLIRQCWSMSPFARPTFENIVQELEALYKSARESEVAYVTVAVR